MSELVTYIYALTDPRTGEARYVGKTVKPLRVRLSQHVSASRSGRRYVDHWIAAMLGAGVRPQMALLEEVAGEAWPERERWWIAEHVRRGARLTNASPGGDGAPGAVVSAESRAKISAANRGRVHGPSAALRAWETKRANGWQMPASAVQAMSETRRGVPRPPAVIEKLRAANLGRRHSQERRAKSRQTWEAKLGRAVWAHRPCGFCGKEVRVRARRARGSKSGEVFCGRACSGARRKQIADAAVSLICGLCGTTFTRLRCQLTGATKTGLRFCGNSCSMRHSRRGSLARRPQ